MKPRIGVIGNGVVGKSVVHVFREVAHRITVHDKYQKSASLADAVGESHFIFLCLPTPCDFAGQRIDLSIMDEVLEKIVRMETGPRIFIIKSTVVPGTTLSYARRYPDLRLAMVPEFLREASFLEDAENPDRIIIGSDDEGVARELRELYLTRFPEAPQFRLSSGGAELAKYMANTYLATKVIFANLFKAYAQRAGEEYGKLKEAVTADSRITDDHLEVTQEGGFGGKCFPKDLNALIGFARENGLPAELLETVWEMNLRVRRVRDWDDIPGASARNRHWVQSEVGEPSR